MTWGTFVSTTFRRHMPVPVVRQSRCYVASSEAATKFATEHSSTKQQVATTTCVSAQETTWGLLSLEDTHACTILYAD